MKMARYIRRRLWTALLCACFVLGAPISAAAHSPAGNLLFKTAIVARDWTPWWIPQPAGVPAWQSRMPEYKAAAPYEYRVHSGKNAQQLFSFHGTHIGGIYQVVEGIQPGSKLRFTIWGHAWAGSSDNPRESVGGGPMHMTIGIDPTGGTSARSLRVIWSREQDPLDVWGQFEVEAVAIGSAVTVFTRSAPEYPTKHNDVYWDTASLTVIEPPPTPTLSGTAARQVIVYRSPVGTSPPTVAPAATPGETQVSSSPTAKPSPTQMSTSSPTVEPTAMLTNTPAPTPITSAICVLAYTDRNGNRTYDGQDELLPGAFFTLTVSGRTGSSQTYATEGNEPFCFKGLAPGIYRVTHQSPPGYISAAHEWAVKLADRPALIWVEHRKVRTRAELLYPSLVVTVATQQGSKPGKLFWGAFSIPAMIVVVLAARAVRKRR